MGFRFLLLSIILPFALLASGRDYEYPPTGPWREAPVLLREDLFAVGSDLQRKSFHAATIAELSGGDLLVAANAGEGEGSDYWGITQWRRSKTAGSWGAPEEVISTPQRNPVLLPLGSRQQVWMVHSPIENGAARGRTSLAVLHSDDDGRLWGPSDELIPATRFPMGRCSPVRLSDGRWLFPFSLEENKMRYGACLLVDNAGKWTESGLMRPPSGFAKVTQPSVVELGSGKLVAFLRTSGWETGYSESTDRGQTWKQAISLPIPNASSSVAAIGLGGDNVLLIYNHSSSSLRVPLVVRLSHDGGKTWLSPLALETEKRGPFSYPAAIRDSQGRLHLVYSMYRETIRHVVLDPASIIKASMEAPPEVGPNLLPALRSWNIELGTGMKSEIDPGGSTLSIENTGTKRAAVRFHCELDATPLRGKRAHFQWALRRVPEFGFDSSRSVVANLFVSDNPDTPPDWPPLLETADQRGRESWRMIENTVKIPESTRLARLSFSLWANAGDRYAVEIDKVSLRALVSAEARED